MQRCLAAVLVTRAALALRLRGFQPVAGRLLTAPAGAAQGRPPGEALTRAFLTTDPLPWSTCLSRSVALVRYLQRRGLPARLMLGAQPAQPGRPFQAHAWVAMNGRSLLPDAGHQPLKSRPNRGQGDPEATA